MPIALSEAVCRESVENLNQVLADTITLRDLYKKHHWQISGPTFYQLHLLFDKHADEQSALVDAVAERIQLLGGVSVAMAPDVAETTIIPRPPKGREGPAAQISRSSTPTRSSSEARSMAGRADEGRRWNQRPAREQCHPDKRASGMVRRRACGRRAACPDVRARKLRRHETMVSVPALPMALISSSMPCGRTIQRVHRQGGQPWMKHPPAPSSTKSA